MNLLVPANQSADITCISIYTYIKKNTENSKFELKRKG